MKMTQSIRTKDDLNKYLLENGHILFDYYNEKKTETTTATTQGASILDFFKQETPQSSKTDDQATGGGGNVDGDDTQKTRYQYAQQYLSNINDDYVVLEKEDFQITCEECKEKMTLLMEDGQYVCPTCGNTMDWIVDSERVTYKEPPKEVSYFCYKRMNHFNEWLAQFQAKESTDIPKEVYRKVLSELSKDKHTHASQITADRVRAILRRLGYNSRYYEHVPHIMNRIAGIKPPSIDRKTEETLRMMFRQIQVPFNKYCPRRNTPNKRKNFLHYGYVMYKFLQLLEHDDLLKHFSLLKSREKLHEHDELWQKICKDLRWQFIPSV